MTTNEASDMVVRLQARLISVDRHSRMARVVFAVPLGDDVDALAEQAGGACLLGVLLTPGEVSIQYSE